MTSPATTIVNARVFDGVISRDWTSIRFTDGVITDCATTSVARQGDEVVDAAGGTVLPGLIDAHLHLAPGALTQSLNFGITTVLDMFSTPDVVIKARLDAASRDDVADVRSSSIGATAPGGHPSALYAPFPTIGSADEAEAFVQARISEGADYLKLFSGTGGRWPALDPASITALVHAAHTRGLTVVAHVSSAAGVAEVVAAGADVLAHTPADGELPAALIDQIADAGVAVVPTLATIENTMHGSGGTAVLRDPRLAAMLDDATTSRLTSQVSHTRSRAAPTDFPAENTVRRMADAGVTLLAGTDAPNPGTVFGASLHRELELLVRSGTSPSGALSAATATAAHAFSLTDRGLIAKGRRADLLLVSGDPTTDITTTRGITHVWRAGIPHHRHAYTPTVAEAEQLNKFDTKITNLIATIRPHRAP